VLLNTTAGTAVPTTGMTADSLPQVDSVTGYETFTAHTTTTGTVTPTVTFTANALAAIVVFGP
jgi:hypothetical protein